MREWCLVNRVPRYAMAQHKKQANVAVDASKQLYIWACDAATSDQTVGIGELCGLNTGRFAKVSSSAESGHITWKLDSDLSLVILVEGGSKQVMTLAELIHMGFEKWGIPQVAVQCHTVKPRMVMKELRREPFQTSYYSCHCVSPIPRPMPL